MNVATTLFTELPDGNMIVAARLADGITRLCATFDRDAKIKTCDARRGDQRYGATSAERTYMMGVGLAYYLSNTERGRIEFATCMPSSRKGA